MLQILRYGLCDQDVNQLKLIGSLRVVNFSWTDVFEICFSKDWASLEAVGLYACPVPKNRIDHILHFLQFFEKHHHQGVP